MTSSDNQKHLQTVRLQPFEGQFVVSAKTYAFDLAVAPIP